MGAKQEPARAEQRGMDGVERACEESSKILTKVHEQALAVDHGLSNARGAQGFLRLFARLDQLHARLGVEPRVFLVFGKESGSDLLSEELHGEQEEKQFASIHTDRVVSKNWGKELGAPCEHLYGEGTGTETKE